MKSPIFSIHFSGPLELVADLLNRHFASLPAKEQAGVWKSKEAAVNFCQRRRGTGARFTLGYDAPDLVRDDIAGLMSEWLIVETPTSRRWVMRRCYYEQWLVCFPGGSNWVAPRLFETLAFRDEIALLAVHDAEGMKVIGSGPDPNKHYQLVKE